MKKIDVNFKIIENYLKDNNLTIKQFCKLCDIKYYNYRQLTKGDANVNAEVLYRVCKTTSILLKDLIGF